MDESDVRIALEHLEGMNDPTMDKISHYIVANLDDFLECFENACPECNEMGWDKNGEGFMRCSNGHEWLSEK
jgi:hypothetical protein